MSHVTMLALEFGDANVVVTSLVLVFGMLVALCLLITLEGKLMSGTEKKPAAPKPASAPARTAAARLSGARSGARASRPCGGSRYPR